MRGFSKALKHNEVYSFLKVNRVSIFALLEKKLDDERLFDIIRYKFSDWKVVHNIFLHHAGRIAVILGPKIGRF